MCRFSYTCFTFLLFAGSASADLLGLRAGIDYWKYDISGSARYKTRNSANNLDVNQDLGYDDGSANSFYLVLEPPIALLPNARLRYTDIDEDADGRLTKTVVYGNTTFLFNEAVSSEFDLKQTDITLYYSPLDNIVSLDLGLNGKYIDSKARITGATSGTEEANVSGWVPMVYLGVAADLPLTGLSVGADGSFTRYDGSDFYDYSLRATYSTPWLLGIDVGYRKLKLNLDDFDDSFADVEFDGPYAGVYLHF